MLAGVSTVPKQLLLLFLANKTPFTALILVNDSLEEVGMVDEPAPSTPVTRVWIAIVPNFHRVIIPIARAEFTIAPLLQGPPASRGEPRTGSVPPASRGNLKELIRVHRLGSLCAKCAHFLPSPPAPLPQRGRGEPRADLFGVLKR